MLTRLCVVVLLCPTIARAQGEPSLLIDDPDIPGQSVERNPWFFRTGLAPAYILPDNPFQRATSLSGNATQWTRGLTIEVGRQTDGKEEWHRLYGMPAYGFGL